LSQISAISEQGSAAGEVQVLHRALRRSREEDLRGQSLSAGDVVQQTIPAEWRLLRGNNDTTVLQRLVVVNHSCEYMGIGMNMNTGIGTGMNMEAQAWA
jgi:hypothetical protein